MTETIKSLKARRSRALAEMKAILDKADQAARHMTASERDAFDVADTRLKNIERAIGTLKNYTKRKAAHEIQGTPNERLSADQSMTGWLERAAQNGVTYQRADGGSARVQYHAPEFLNEYFGQRMGFSKPGAEMRALGEDTAGSGQAIAPQAWTATFIDFLYPLGILGPVGATRVPMGAELVNIPQLTGTPAPTWIAENAATSIDGTPAFSTLQLSAKGAFFDLLLYSIELSQDAYVQGGLPGMLAASAAKKYAIALDNAWLYGVTGNTGNPGISNETGINLRKYAAHSGTAGQAPADFSEPSVMAEIVRNANAVPNALICSPALYGTLSRLNVSAYAKYWTPPTDVQALWPPVYSTSIPNVETDPASGVPAQAGGTMTSLYCGDFTRVIMGIRLDMITNVLTERYMDQLQFGLFTALRASIRTSHPESFIRSYGALTT